MAVLADQTRLESPIPEVAGYWSSVWQRFRRDPVAIGAGLVILLLILMAIFAPYIAPADPFRGASLRRLRPIGTPGFPLGSDELGRDMLTRLIYGARLSLFMGVTPVFIAFFFGSAITRSRALKLLQSVNASLVAMVRIGFAGYVRRPDL